MKVNRHGQASFLSILVIIATFFSSQSALARDEPPLAIFSVDNVYEFWRQIPTEIVKTTKSYDRYRAIVEDEQWALSGNVEGSDESKAIDWFNEWVDQYQPELMQGAFYSNSTWYISVYAPLVTEEAMNELIEGVSQKFLFLPCEEVEAELDEEAKPKDGSSLHELSPNSKACWFLYEDHVCFVSGEAAVPLCKRLLLDEITDQVTSRRLVRCYSALKKMPTRTPHEGGKEYKAVCAFSAKAFISYLDRIPAKLVQVLGLDEFVGAGFSISLRTTLDRKDEKDSQEKESTLICDGLVMNTWPKRGVSKVFDSLQPIEELPPISRHCFFFSAANIDPDSTFDQILGLYETLYGAGSLEKDYRESSPLGQPDFDLENDLVAGLSGSFFSYNMLDPSVAVPRRLDVIGVRSTDAMRRDAKGGRIPCEI